LTNDVFAETVATGKQLLEELGFTGE